MLLGHTFVRLSNKSSLLVVVLVGLTGCATGSHFSGGAAASGAVSVPMIYHEVSGDTLSIDDRPAGALVWLGAIPGEIYGAARVRLMTIPVSNAAVFEIDLGALRDIAEKQSAMLTPQASTSGWKIMPKDTRLIRVATSLIYKTPHREQPTTSFIDSKSGRILMLVYFDRSCSITGTLDMGAGSYDKVNVKISEAGFHWIEVVGAENVATHEIRHASGTATPVFEATLPAN